MATIRIFKHYLRVPFLILGVFELSVLFASVFAAAYIRFYAEPEVIEGLLQSITPKAMVFAGVMNISMIAMGLYQARLREGMAGVMLRTAVSFLMAGIILALLFYMLPDLFIGRGILAMAAIIAFFVIGTFRPIFLDSIDENNLKRRILIYGTGEQAASIIQRLRRRSDQRSFHILGFIHIHGQTDHVEEQRVLRINLPLREYAREHEIDEIVVAVDDRRNGFALDELLDCKMSGIDVIDVLTFFEREAGKIRIDMVNPSWLVFSDGFAQNVVRLGLKRIFDLTASLLILLLTWPIMLLTALCILLEDRFKGTVFYRQVRVGQNGIPFELYKFRSMCSDAEVRGNPVWADANDSRVTRVGALIRRTRIDELPQLFNVIKGDMSFVGPRPERPEFVMTLSERVPYYTERHRVKPGITGWAQLCYPYAASTEDATEKQQFDLYYVKNHSLLLDCLILMQTTEVVLFGKGAR